MRLLERQKNVLLIEDDQAIRDMVALLLEIEGYQVTVAQDGLAGISALRTGAPPNVILLDMMMPVMNGWQVLDFLRANALTSQVPVVVVSAYGESARSVRPQAFVPKPIQLNSLLSAIERCCA